MSAPVTISARSAGLEMMPRFVQEPIATEALIEAAPASINPAGLSAAVLPLRTAQDEPVSALLARVEDAAGNVLHEWPYAIRAWCIASWAESPARRPRGESQGASAAGNDVCVHRFSLPPVSRRNLASLLAGALLYGSPGICPHVFLSHAWEELDVAFRRALPNEALALLLGRLCQDPATGKMFTLIEAVSIVDAESGPSSVCGTASDVAESASDGCSGTLVGVAHSHPHDKPCVQIAISRTDLETFRLRLRSAHMLSLIANVAPGSRMSAVALSWARGGAVPAGFYVADGD